jgi:hypothetical protein
MQYLKNFRLFCNESNQEGNKITFTEQVTDSHNNQLDYILSAYVDGELGASVTYSIYKGEVSIGLIESYIRGKSIGFELMKELCNRYGIENIDPGGYFTSDGVKLWDKVIKYFGFDRAKYMESISKHLPVEIVDEIKDEAIKQFVRNLVNLGREKAWKLILANPDIDRIKYDLNDIAEIAEWIKGSKTNQNDITDVPPVFVMELVDSLTK